MFFRIGALFFDEGVTTGFPVYAFIQIAYKHIFFSRM